ncbi:ESAT-6 protein secretion system EspG family protein [Tamaricihabitans halophyticus]|uniref:ESAT-6 protein secretion system EspG family protein n=1 Tax=Tamaricihabitans halophyticus TaxID=1262583 RepID=A0A4R2R567_9PSEU|nr:ESX secretion-associated protein EspG [Tamaricihabitans halophyticus]TCP56878.1 ESAT-6 protein secretion system EspG family protein [Tamaricihabitans halophyticus]
MLSHPVTISAASLATLLHRERIGVPHITLSPTAMWLDHDERRDADKQAGEEIDGLEVGDQRGLDVEFAASLAVLCRPTVEYYGWINEGKTTLAVLAASIGNEAVLAVRENETVFINQLDPERLPEGLVAQIPELAPAKGKPINVAQEEMLAEAEQARTPSRVITRTASHAVRQVQSISSLPTDGGGELYVAVRDSLGRRKHTEQPLRYADTSEGRWLNITLPGQARTMLVISPGTRKDIARRMRDMHAALTD